MILKSRFLIVMNKKHMKSYKINYIKRWVKPLFFSLIICLAGHNPTWAQLTVLSPNSDTVVEEGQLLEIHWFSQLGGGTFDPGGGSVSIELYKSGNFMNTIAINTEDNGWYLWPVPSGITPGNDYQVKVSSNDGSDLSPMFTIASSVHEINITAPGSSTSNFAGDQLSIQWNSNYSGGNVRIRLFKNGTVDGTISSTTSNNGSFSWSIPADLDESNQYQIHISEVNGDAEDLSPNFSIVHKSINVIKPTSGELAVEGEPLRIEWEDNYNPSLVKIELVNSSTLQLVHEINNSAFNDGSINWTVDWSGFSSGFYRIRISDTNSGSEIPGVSDAFQIVSKYVSVTGGNNSSVTAGQNHTFSWEHNLTAGNIELHYRNAQDNWIYIDTVPLSATSKTWATPSGSDYVSSTQVRLRNTSDTSVTTFVQNITLEKTLTITAPSAGMDIVEGNSLPIRWNANYSTEPVKLELHKGGSFNQTISSSAPNSGSSGSFDWVVPQGVSNGGDYSIKISDLNDSVSDNSGLFSLTEKFINVIKPVSGELAIEGEPLRIEWEDNYNPQNVKIELVTSSTTQLVHEINNSAFNDKKWIDWVVDWSGFSSGFYRIRISDADPDLETPEGFSDEFQIESKNITVTGGNNSSVTAGQNHTFSWEHNLTAGNIELHYRNAQDNWIYIDTVPLSASSKTWATPSGSDYVSSTQVRLRNTSDTSVTTFVQNITLEKTLAITAPSVGMDIAEGDTLNIEWESNYTGGTVEIELLRDNQVEDLITSSVANEGFFNWKIPYGIEGGNNYRVKITETGGSTGQVSDEFIITSLYFSLISPNNNDVWKIDETQQIFWESNEPDRFLSIELLNADEELVGVIANEVNMYTTQNSGYYLWNISNTLPDNGIIKEGEMYRVKILDDQGVKDTSDPFMISFKDYISIKSPAANSGYQPGSTMGIEFASNIDEVSIYLKGEALETVSSGYSYHVVSDPDSKEWHSFTWAIPENLPDGNYFIEITGGNTIASSSEFSLGRGMVIPIITYDEFDQWGNVLKVTDANGNSIRYQYDHTGTKLTEVKRVNPTGMNLVLEAVYNDKGLPVQLIDENGISLFYNYDAFNRLQSVETESEILQNFEYIITGESFSASNPNRIETQSYAMAGNIRKTVEYVDGLGRMVQVQSANGEDTIVSSVDYDGRGREWQIWKASPMPGGIGYVSDYENLAEFYYNNSYAFSEQLYEDNPLNFPLHTIPEGGEDMQGAINFTYHTGTGNTAHLKFTEMSDEENLVNRTYTDGWGRTILTVGDPAGENIRTQFEYDLLDRVTKVYHPTYFTGNENMITEYEYDTRGNLVRKISPDAGSARYAYDAVGNLRFTRDANQADDNMVGFTTYDFAHRPLVEGLFGAEWSSLDPESSPLQESDNINWRGVHEYDSKPSTTEYPWSLFAGEIDGKTVVNTMGQLTARAWRFAEEGVAESSNLDGMNITGDETYLAATTITVGNTVVDTLGSLTLKAGETITLKPGFHVESGSTFSASIDASLISQSSDGISTIAATNPWQVELFSYNEEGLPAEKWTWTGDNRDWDTHLAYDYNRLGEVTRMKVQVGSETLYQHYEYNPLGQLTSVTVTTDGIADTETPEVTYTYTPSGAIDEITYRGNTTITHGYDIRGRLTDINNIDSTGSSPFAAQYDYKKNSRINWASFWNPNIDLNGNLTDSHRKYTYDYTYDNPGRLLSADFKLDSSNPNAFDLAGIAYDANGNILSMQRYGAAGTLIDDMSYSYTNANNQLTAITDAAGQPTSWDGATGVFSYDLNGNLVSMTGNPSISDIAYDHRNLSIHTYLDGDVEQIANYNAEGQRILKEVQMPSGTTWDFYVRDGLSTLAVISNGDLQFMNLHGNGTFGRVVASSGAISASGDKRYYISDLLGSVRAVVDETGVEIENRDYDPWGVPMDQRQYVSGDKAHEQFSGQELDDQTGWYHFGQRDLMAIYGRWPSPDRFADKYPSHSPYSYALNNPVGFIDVNGDSIIVLDDLARQDLLNTLPTEVREFVVFEKSGKVDIDAFTKAISDLDINDINIEAFVEVSQAEQIVQLGTATELSFRDANGNIKTENLDELYRGFTLAPDGSNFQSVTDRVEVTINSRSNSETRAKFTAHEIYGHARFFIQGLPWIHDIPPQGNVDRNTRLINAIIKHENQAVKNFRGN